MDNNNPLISIITVCYNASDTIGRTIDSVDNQVFEDYEHLIIDGKSSDTTLEIVRSATNSRRVVISEPDKGIYDAMNKGLGLSRGKYLIFLNAGDKFHSTGSLKQIADAICKGREPGVVYGQTNHVDDNGNFISPRHLTAPPNLTYRDFSQGMLVCHQAFVVLKSLAPLYNLKYRFSADYEWCIRCLQRSDSNYFIDDVLIDYLAEGMTTANRRKSLIERFRIMSEYYGMWSTLFRHIGFMFRFLNNKRSSRANK